MKSIESPLIVTAFDRLAEKIELEMGLSFANGKRRDMAGAVQRMAKEKRLDEKACIHWLLAGAWDKAKADLCAVHLTIGETYFFREPRAFDLVCDYAQKKMQTADSANQKLRIWSAGCCTGEEAYSIAMALRNRVPELSRDKIFILATDLNASNLEFARNGVYRQWSFRNTHIPEHRLHFSEEGDSQLRLHDRIKDMVKFAELNLAAAVYPSAATDSGAMDIIFCRNVLMYFSREQARSVIERFRECLVDGGWLVVSPSEASAEMFAGFSGVHHADAIYFQKSDLSAAILPVQRVPDDAESSAAAGWGLESTVGFQSPESVRRVEAGFDRTLVQTKSHSAERIDSTKIDTDAISRMARGAAEADVIEHTRRLVNEGRGEDALQCLELALQNGQPTAELYHAKALVAMEAGDDREAMQNLKRVIYLEPDFILAHYLIGVLQSRQNNPEQAAKPFETANELLASLDDDDIVPGTEGLPAAYLRESVQAYLTREN